jgi:hypothetical protein
LTLAISGGFANFIAKHEGRCPTWNLDAPPDFRHMAPRPVNQPGKRPIRARDQIFKTIQRPVTASQPTKW